MCGRRTQEITFSVEGTGSYWLVTADGALNPNSKDDPAGQSWSTTKPTSYRFPSNNPAEYTFYIWTTDTTGAVRAPRKEVAVTVDGVSTPEFTSSSPTGSSDAGRIPDVTFSARNVGTALAPTTLKYSIEVK